MLMTNATVCRLSALPARIVCVAHIRVLEATDMVRDPKNMPSYFQ